MAVDSNVVECELAERDQGFCVCDGRPTLDILKDVQRAYEERMQQLHRSGGSKKIQMQVELLQSWVNDLVEQNSLLVRTIEQLEIEVTSRLLLERRKHNEMVSELRVEASALRQRLARKDSDLQGLLEVLRRLREFDYCTLDEIHFNEVTQSDIFGAGLWGFEKFDQGDLRRQSTDQKKNMKRFK